MPDVPVVSVIIPAWNRAGVIGETLQSVLAQTYGDWECVVVDDGSTDETPEVVERFIRLDPRFRMVRQANSTASAARNRGAAEAAGKYLAFLDSDDLFEPDKLEWQVAALEHDPQATIIYGETFNFRDGDPTRGGMFFSNTTLRPSGAPPGGFEQLLIANPIIAPVVRSEAFRQSGGFDTTLPSAEDWDMWLTLARRGTLLHEPRLAQRYRTHEGPAGNKSARTLRSLQCVKRVFGKHIRHVPPGRRRVIQRQARELWRKGYGPRLLREADSATVAGDWPQARQLWRALVRLDPSVLLRHRHVRINFAWAVLPTEQPPVWRRKASGSLQVTRWHD